MRSVPYSSEEIIGLSLLSVYERDGRRTTVPSPSVPRSTVSMAEFATLKAVKNK
ncbi:hypothetical protein E4U30_004434, partial [Claviceps sp. LM220 group G6]